ncbi:MULTISPECIES: NAD(P)/FAD-dependent oxidoreductase [Acidiplasma]|jgi:thioredoxin reductase (NADPH)|uniref:Thioredoxin reductase n=3 Tax=Acidiplasma TaxID=507753 RepID=A0A0Q0WIN3_9ARCH|nr:MULTISPECIES: FAD-dependent oxidoreductase [Acidiplasma]KQB33862.1 thioredoxin reductase [Acidiplasma aeolicum]KQB35458.1 thioredoxin reductase [Acidiplasma cupricumulans]WMT55804.1 MAG: FAD-dependent oxidoreductase [Acidiplasma sp.]
MMQFNVRSNERDYETDYDVIIIGAGAAGYSAGIYIKRSGMSVAILEREAVPGGNTALSPLVENYLGFKAIEGSDLAEEFRKHYSEYGKIITEIEVRNIKKEGNNFVIETNRETFTARAVIVSTGTTHRKMNVPGEEEYYGKGISYCSTCDGYLFKGKDVAVIGGGNSGAISALYLNGIAKNVSIIAHSKIKKCEDAYIKSLDEKKIPFILNAETEEFLGDGKKLTGLRYKDLVTGDEKTVNLDGVFIYIGVIPQTSFLKNIGVKLDSHGFIVTDDKCRTNVPGIYAAGDVIAGSEEQIATAVGDGSRAAITLYTDKMNKKF